MSLQLPVLTERERQLARRLLHLAKMRRMTSYSEEASRLNPPILARHPVYCKMLDRINVYTYLKYDLFLAAIVKHKGKDTIGFGFFDAVSRVVGSIPTPEDKKSIRAHWGVYDKFWKNELEKLWKYADRIEIE